MKTIQITAFRFIILFVLLFIISVPFGYHYIVDIGAYTSPFFEWIVKRVGDSVFQIQRPYTHQILSDSTGMYIHVLVLAIFSFSISLVWTLCSREKEQNAHLNYWFQVVISYYLSLQLFKYGFDKLFKHQFYLPEPNTVFTPLGDLSPDILYWSTIGTSYSYSVFSGFIEIIPAALLLFQRTRIIGAMVAMMVMLNVVMINFGFDISVKIYSCFLLLLSFVISLSGIQKLFCLFVLRQPIDIPKVELELNTTNKILFYAVVKFIAIALILLESLFIYFKTNNFNDDQAKRPYLHGAYAVVLFVAHTDTIPAASESGFKRIFIHRQGYFITQNKNDGMTDYQMRNDLKNKQLILTEYDSNEIVLDYIFSEKDSVLTLSGKIKNTPIHIQAKQIDMSQLPLFQSNFHWTIDDYQ